MLLVHRGSYVWVLSPAKIWLHLENATSSLGKYTFAKVQDQEMLVRWSIFGSSPSSGLVYGLDSFSRGCVGAWPFGTVVA